MKNFLRRKVVATLMAMMLLVGPSWTHRSVGSPLLAVSHIGAVNCPVRIVSVRGTSTNQGLWVRARNTTNAAVEAAVVRGDLFDCGEAVQRMMVAEADEAGGRGGAGQLHAADYMPRNVISRPEYRFHFEPLEEKLIYINALCVDIAREPLSQDTVWREVTISQVESPAVKKLFDQVDRINADLQTKRPGRRLNVSEWSPLAVHDSTTLAPMLSPSIMNCCVWRLFGATNADFQQAFPFTPSAILQRSLKAADSILESEAE